MDKQIPGQLSAPELAQDDYELFMIHLGRIDSRLKQPGFSLKWWLQLSQQLQHLISVIASAVFTYISYTRKRPVDDDTWTGNVTNQNWMRRIRQWTQVYQIDGLAHQIDDIKHLNEKLANCDSSVSKLQVVYFYVKNVMLPRLLVLNKDKVWKDSNALNLYLVSELNDLLYLIQDIVVFGIYERMTMISEKEWDQDFEYHDVPDSVMHEFTTCAAFIHPSTVPKWAAVSIDTVKQTLPTMYKLGQDSFFGDKYKRETRLKGIKFPVSVNAVKWNDRNEGLCFPGLHPLFRDMCVALFGNVIEGETRNIGLVAKYPRLLHFYRPNTEFRICYRPLVTPSVSLDQQVRDFYGSEEFRVYRKFTNAMHLWVSQYGFLIRVKRAFPDNTCVPMFAYNAHTVSPKTYDTQTTITENWCVNTGGETTTCEVHLTIPFEDSLPRAFHEPGNHRHDRRELYMQYGNMDLRLLNHQLRVDEQYQTKVNLLLTRNINQDT